MIGVGILGINVIFMDNGVKCLRHVNDGKKRFFHIRQYTLPWIWYKGRDPKNQKQWPLIQTYCFQSREMSKEKIREIKYVSDYFKCHKNLETGITKAKTNF